MPLPNVYEPQVVQQLAQRLHALQPNTTPLWGSMSVSQMLAHCNVTYDMVYTTKYKAPNAFTKLILKAFVKKMVTNEVPYKKNGQTAPQFLIKSPKDFEQEKQTLLGHIHKTAELGQAHFEGKESISFGVLQATQWNNMFYKHLDHHLRQFGV